jgi:hypothetical protein
MCPLIIALIRPRAEAEGSRRVSGILLHPSRKTGWSWDGGAHHAAGCTRIPRMRRRWAAAVDSAGWRDDPRGDKRAGRERNLRELPSPSQAARSRHRSQASRRANLRRARHSRSGSGCSDLLIADSTGIGEERQATTPSPIPSQLTKGFNLGSEGQSRGMGDDGRGDRMGHWIPLVAGAPLPPVLPAGRRRSPPGAHGCLASEILEPRQRTSPCRSAILAPAWPWRSAAQHPGDFGDQVRRLFGQMVDHDERSE